MAQPNLAHLLYVVENGRMYNIAMDGMSFLSKITMKFAFTLVLVVWLNQNFQVALLSLEAGFKSTRNKGVVMETNKKVPCLICTCMDRNIGLVAHTVPLCSTDIVLALKKIMICHDCCNILVY